ncbi:hypothetical protein DPMN_078532 [Dreissena polymorpha]|uniref:Uncharacterized protein n=1 Tax=Dreissena polymorpha TaxID=45954 RepID=A0A9D3YQR8_DREPO|nr:hypothetical protein DPMN_078532 [Dreissena polymorpha]
MPCFTVRMNIQTKRLNPVKACRVPAEPRYTVTTPALTGVIPASDPGRAAATPRFNRGQPGLHRVSIQMFNTSGMNQELPGRTGNNRLGTGNNRDCIGNNRDGTVRAPVYLCNVAIKGLCRHSPGRCRSSAGVVLGPGGAKVPSRLFPVQSRLFQVPRRSLPVLPGDSRFIPEVLNILILSRWSTGCPRSSTVYLGGAPVHPGRAPVHPGRCLITHWGSAGIIVRLGLNRIVTRSKFTGRHVRS